MELKSVFHPSDFTKASEVAFAHALKLALAARLELSVLHVDSQYEDLDWSEFPGVRQTLVRWGALPEGSSREDVSKTGLGVHKVIATHKDPVASILGYLNEHPTDLIVLSTHQKGGLSDWLKRTVAEPVARRSGEATLFVPHGVDGFVSPEDGSVNLSRVLVPVASRPSPHRALRSANAVVQALGCKDISVTTLYVGNEGDMPPVRSPEGATWKLEEGVEDGDVVERILATAADWEADLVVMATEGRHGFLDAVRGSTSERVLRGLSCPLLAVPAVG